MSTVDSSEDSEDSEEYEEKDPPSPEKWPIELQNVKEELYNRSKGSKCIEKLANLLDRYPEHSIWIFLDDVGEGDEICEEDYPRIEFTLYLQDEMDKKYPGLTKFILNKIPLAPIKCEDTYWKSEISGWRYDKEGAGICVCDVAEELFYEVKDEDNFHLVDVTTQKSYEYYCKIKDL